MLLSLLTRKEKLKFLDLVMHMVSVDGEPTAIEQRLLNIMLAEVGDGIVTMIDDFYNTAEHFFLEDIRKEFGITDFKKKQLMRLVYNERDLRERAKRVVSH
jgi:hypothetical protein